MFASSILIVDDDENVRSSLAMVLKKEGFRVFSTGQGLNALSILCGERINMVLLDLSLPDVHGLTLLPMIQKKHADVPVLIFTATPTYDPKAEAARLGIRGYLMKPVDPVDLLERVRTILAGPLN